MYILKCDFNFLRTIRGSIFFFFSFSWAGGLMDEEEESEGGRVQGGKTKLSSLSLNMGRPQIRLSTIPMKYSHKHGPVAVRSQSHGMELILLLCCYSLTTWAFRPWDSSSWPHRIREYSNLHRLDQCDTGVLSYRVFLCYTTYFGIVDTIWSFLSCYLVLKLLKELRLLASLLIKYVLIF